MSLVLDLSDHTALVTGANHGIGAATARTLAGYGVAVVMTYLRLEPEPDPGTPEAYGRHRAQDAEQVLAEIVEGGGRAVAVEEDLRDAAAVARLFDAAEQEFGPVDILVNNASGWLADTFTTQSGDRLGRQLRRVSADTIDRQFSVDARAGALLISEFADRHHRHDLQWGRIIGLTSGGALGFPEEASYGAAKAALENFTMTAAFELAGRGITANMVYPPVTDTGWVTDEVRRQVASSRELIHVANPADVAEVIAFLVSDHARYITANTLHMR